MNKRFYIQVSTSDMQQNYIVKFDRKRVLVNFSSNSNSNLRYFYATLWKTEFKRDKYHIAGYICCYGNSSELDLINSYRRIRRVEIASKLILE